MAIRNFTLTKIEKEMLEPAEVQLCNALDNGERTINMLYDFINESCNDAEFQDFTVNELSK
jgi:hypothetical protein